jgi:hypothetical protein
MRGRAGRWPYLVEGPAGGVRFGEHHSADVQLARPGEEGNVLRAVPACFVGGVPAVELLCGG